MDKKHAKSPGKIAACSWDEPETVLQAIERFTNEAEAMGFDQANLNGYVREEVKEWKKVERENRALRRETERSELERLKLKEQIELERLKLKEQSDYQAARVKEQIELAEVTHNHTLERINRQAELQEQHDNNAPVKRPKLPEYKEGDDLDSYIRRFEIHAKQNKWADNEWGSNFSCYLPARALSIYNSLNFEQTQDWQVVKRIMQNAYNLTEEGYRSKLRFAKRNTSETCSQFLVRLENYINRWIEMSLIEKTYDDLRELFLKEQLLNCSLPEIRILLRENHRLPISDLVKKIDMYEEARKYDSSTNRASNNLIRSNSQKQNNRNVNQNQSTNKGSNVCRRCGRLGHDLKACHASRHAVTGKSLMSNSCLLKVNDELPEPESSRGVIVTKASDSDLPQQVTSTCDTQLYKMVPVTSLVSVVTASPTIKNTRMPITVGKVNGHVVRTLRDTGCDGVIIRESLVKPHQFTNEKKSCMFMNCSTDKPNKMAKLYVDTPFYSGIVNALCLKTPVCDLVIGQIQGAKLPCKCEMEMSDLKADRYVGNSPVTAKTSFGNTSTKTSMHSPTRISMQNNEMGSLNSGKKIITQNKSSPSRISAQIGAIPSKKTNKIGAIPMNKSTNSLCENDTVELKNNSVIETDVVNEARAGKNDSDTHQNNADIQNPETVPSVQAQKSEAFPTCENVQKGTERSCRLTSANQIIPVVKIPLTTKQGLTHTCDSEPHKNIEQSEQMGPEVAHRELSTNIIEAGAVETRAQILAQKQKKSPLVVTKIDEFDNVINTDTLLTAQQEDRTLDRVFKLCKSGKIQQNGKGGLATAQFRMKGKLLYRYYKSPQVNFGQEISQLVVPEKYRLQVMKVAHDSVMGGHLGHRKTLDRVMSQFFWPNLYAEIKRYCQSCDVCQKTTPRGKVGKVPLGHMPLISIPFQRVGVDLVGPIKSENPRKFQYILVLVDYATRYPEATPLKNIRAETVAEALVNMYSRVGVPREILTDQGKQFISDVMREVSRLLSVRQMTSSPYHPQTNGLVERFNGVLKRMLARMCEERPNDWDRYINPLLFAYREAPQASLGFSPFELLYGRTVRGPMAILRELWTNENVEPETKLTYTYVLDLRNRLEQTCSIALNELQKSSDIYRHHFNKTAKNRQFQAKDKVLLLLPTAHDKLHLQWQGPFEVMERVGTCDYRIDKGGKIKLFHANMLKRYEERTPSTTKDNSDTPGLFMKVSVAFIDSQPLDHGIEGPGAEFAELIEFLPRVGKQSIKDVHVYEKLELSQKQDVSSLLKKYQTILTDVPGRTNVVEYDIKLTSDEPIFTKQYPLPLASEVMFKKEVDDMLELDIIERSNSPYSSPVVLVKKQDGTIRLCNDYRKLNRITVFDAEPMPNPEELFARLHRGKHLSKFDLTKGFWQIPLSQKAKEKTAFQAPQGHMHYKVLPFGLKNSPANFSRMMRIILEGLQDHVVNLIDDILMYNFTWQGHLHTIETVLTRLKQAGLTAKPSKCYIGYEKLEFLGHIVGRGLLQMVPDKINALMEAPSPKTITQVRSFLGFCSYYRKFVPNFAAIAAPLHDLTKKGQPRQVNWENVHQIAFTELRRALNSDLILHLPNFSKIFVLRTDASNEGLGAVLLQYDEEIAFPIAYASRKLSPTESRYAVVEKECLAIVWGLKKFQQYLLLKEFWIETDHQPLIYLNKSRMNNGRLMRWALYLQSFSYRVIAIKGSHNIGADFLSRNAVD